MSEALVNPNVNRQYPHTCSVYGSNKHIQTQVMSAIAIPYIHVKFTRLSDKGKSYTFINQKICMSQPDFTSGLDKDTNF